MRGVHEWSRRWSAHAMRTQWDMLRVCHLNATKGRAAGVSSLPREHRIDTQGRYANCFQRLYQSH